MNRKSVLFIAGLLVILILIVLRGCALLASIETPDAHFPRATAALATPEGLLPALNGDWHVQFRQSGGFAGLSRTLDLSSDRTLVVDDGRTGQKKTGQLSPEKLAQLNRLVGSVVYTPPGKPSGCADCFLFTVQITSAEGESTVEVDEVSLEESGLQDLVNFLMDVMKENGG